MKQYEVISKCVQSLSKPEFIANAYFEHFNHCYNQKIATVNDIVSNAQSENALTNVCIRDIDGEIIRVSVSSLKTIYQHWLSNEEFNDLYTIHDMLGDEDKQINIQSVSEYLGKQIDCDYLCAKAYDILSSDNITEGAQRFYNILNTIPNSSENVEFKDYATYLYEQISAAKDKFTCLQIVNNFTGITQLSTNASEVINTSVDISLYTGENPMVGWLSALDLNVNFNSLVSGYLSVAKVLLVDVTLAIFNIVGKTFKSIATWFKHTFIDPVDYKVTSGDTLEYFNFPAKACSEQTVVVDPEQECFINFGYVFEHILNQDGLVYSERYVKPIDPDKFKEWILTWNSKESWTVGDMIAAFNQLQSMDFTMEKGRDEKEVYIGIKLSYLVYYTFKNFIMNMTAQYPNLEIDFLQGEVSMEDDINDFVPYVAFNPGLILIQLLGTGFAVCNNDDDENPVPNMLCLPIKSPRSITNKNFIELLTTVSTSSSESYNLYSEGIDVSNGYINMSEYQSDTIRKMDYPFLVIDFQNQGREVFLPFTRSEPSFIKNVEVKTDSENRNAVRNFFIGVVVVAASVAVGFASYKLISSAKRITRDLASQIRTINWNYDVLTAMGRKDEAENLYKNTLGIRLKSKFMSKIFGSTLSSTGTAVKSAFDSITDSSIDNVISLIH